MRIGYFGNSPFSARLLERLLQTDFTELVFVVSNPDKPYGRSREPRANAVSNLVKNIPQNVLRKTPLLIQASDLREPALLARLKGLACDVFLVFAYGQILSPELLNLAPKGAINLHASLLPQLRGASPIQNAILNGLECTGWSLQYMVPELDMGPVICQSEIQISLKESAGELGQRMLAEGIELTLSTLKTIALSSERLRSIPQKKEEGSYCHKILKANARIDWNSPAQSIHNEVRAYNPAPMAWSFLEKKKLQIYQTRLVTNTELKADSWQVKPVGALAPSPDSREIWVQTGDGILSLLELQLENRRRMSAQDFLNGFRKKDFVILDL